MEKEGSGTDTFGGYTLAALKELAEKPYPLDITDIIAIRNALLPLIERVEADAERIVELAHLLAESQLAVRQARAETVSLAQNEYDCFKFKEIGRRLGRIEMRERCAYLLSAAGGSLAKALAEVIRALPAGPT